MNAPYDTLTETEWDRVSHVWELLDEGEAERARIEIDGLLRERPGHPDLRIVDAAVALDQGEPRAALEALDGAERSADPALFFHLRAVAEFELALFERARDDASCALAIHPDLAEAHDLMSRLLEHLGDFERAAEHAAEARDIDPGAYHEPLDVNDEQFDRLVQESLAELPAEVRRRLEEWPVVVEPLPSRALLDALPRPARAVRGPRPHAPQQRRPAHDAGRDLPVPPQPAAPVSRPRHAQARGAHHGPARGRPPARPRRG